MFQLFIFAFFGAALAVGFYCLWVSLRAEILRAPMRFGHGHALHPAMDASPIRPISTRR
jgi:hypothetical protein